MKKTIAIIILFFLAFDNFSKAQNKEIDLLFQKFLNTYNSGDLINSNEILLSIINSKTDIPNQYKGLMYNNLCAVNTMMGRYEDALEYSSKAEAIMVKEQQESTVFAEIYINRAYINSIQKSYGPAIEYLEKAIRIFDNLSESDKHKYSQNISAAYLNIGIAYYEIGNFNTASDYLTKSSYLKRKYKLKGLPLVYLNIAKTYVKTNNLLKANEFYLKSIASFIDESGVGYYRLVEAYFDYGLFLRASGRNLESLETLKKSLSISVKNYGDKHTLVSLSYKLIGDHYFNISDYLTSLKYYQNALIAVDKDFNNPDIFTNPSIDSSLFDIRLLDNLKSKAQALELYSGSFKDQEMKLKILRKGLETIELALQLIDRIRNNYLSEESRIYLAENEKETYLFATHLAYELFSTTHETSMGERMYNIAQKAKAAILRNDITGNELLYSSGIPDSLRAEQNLLSGNIAAYNNLILDESRKTDPNSNKIALWKDALFDMNRRKEKVTASIEEVFPQYHDLIRKTEPVSLQAIQKKLNKNELIVDYLLSNQYSGGKRKLFVFLISAKSLDFRELGLDSLFARNAGLLRKTTDPSMVSGLSGDYFKSNSEALNYMYLQLIRPVEDLIKFKRLIIIPDEEIGWLSFDSFLKNKPVRGQSGYEGLDYLINDYTFSYGYSSSLISGVRDIRMRGVKVFAFSPDYEDISLKEGEFSSLKGAGEEIGSIFKWFRGKSFNGGKATKENFMAVLQDQAIFHLAMHSMTDSLNSRYSYLMFDTHSQTPEQGKLFNYEISLTHIKSPMVVLSACNSGGGTLYSGEGLMSLARGFTLAGASSVIKTAWEINDETSRAIITRFYRHLSKGEDKDEAMRLAKLEYLKNSSPAFTNPYYWAAYEVLGDNAPVTHNRIRTIILVSLVVLISVGFLVIYLSRFRIFSDRAR